MGRKAYFARLDDQAKERRRPRRQINGYVPGADKEEDAVRNKDKKLPKTKELHQQTFELSIEKVRTYNNQLATMLTSF